MGNAPFWQLAILQSIGPLNTVLIGTLAIGLWASRITAQTQQRREYQQFRHDLIVEMPRQPAPSISRRSGTGGPGS